MSLFRRLEAYLFWRLVLRQPRFYALLLRILRPDREVTITLFGAPLRINQRTEPGYLRAFRLASRSRTLDSECASLMTLALLLEPDDTFIDIGANVGLYAGQIAKLQDLFPNLKLYAFEAHPETAARLRQSLAGRSVEIHVVALSDRDGSLDFIYGATSMVFGPRGHRAHFQLQDRVVSIPARRLDGFSIEGSRIVLKIDVEGHEREVLDGAAGLFSAGRIKAVFIDGYEDAGIPRWFQGQGFGLFDARSFRPATLHEPPAVLLAIHRP